MSHTIPFSILDLAPIAEGSNAGQSFRNSLDLAQHGERWGYRRFWLAEHHGMPGIASAATAVVMSYVANGTSTIRVGAGGIMLPNHSPLVIAEQFGTLESLYPGRIDLGLGRAPGSDHTTARALRRNLASDADEFPQDVVELLDYFAGSPRRQVRAVPGAGLDVPVWILGSSLFGAQLAAALGLPYAFASHFAPAALFQAVEVYRARFEPSAQLAEPYVMAAVNVIAADDVGTAERSFEARRRMFAKGIFSRPGQSLTDEQLDALLAGPQGAHVDQMLMYTALGPPDDVRSYLDDFRARVGADELITVHQADSVEGRLPAIELTAEAVGLNAVSA